MLLPGILIPVPTDIPSFQTFTASSPERTFIPSSPTDTPPELSPTVTASFIPTDTFPSSLATETPESETCTPPTFIFGIVFPVEFLFNGSEREQEVSHKKRNERRKYFIGK